MNVGDKTLVIICLIFAFLITFSGLASRTILLSSYMELEKQDVSEKLELVEHDIDTELLRIATLNQEWAVWDKTYEFMEDKNPSYSLSYLTDEILTEAGIDFVFYIDNSGDMVYGKVIDLGTGTEISVPDDLLRIIINNEVPLAKNVKYLTRGVIQSESGTRFITSCPILPNSEVRPLRGTLIIGKKLDEDYLRTFTDIPGLSIELKAREEIPPFGSEVFNGNRGEQIEVLNEKWIAGYIPLTGISGEPEVFMKVNYPRDLYTQGKKDLLFFIMVFFFTCLIIGVASNFLIKNLFISRLIEIERFVTAVKEENNLSKRIDINGGNEFIRLSGGINSMLENLERSRKELMHRESEKQALLDSLNEVLIFLDSNFQIIWTNSRFSEYFGKIPEEVIGHSHKELWGNKNAQLIRFIKKVLDNGDEKSGAFELNFEDRATWSVNISAVRGSDEKLLGVIESILDVTEVKKSEEKMLQAKLLAENANRAKSEFLSNMSHELRTPLNSVIGFSDLLLEKNFGSLSPKQEKFINNISTSGKHLLCLINDILDLSKVEAGKMEFRCIEFSVQTKIEEVRALLFPVSGRKNISMALEIEEGISTIYTDEGKFVQILYNLLSNAIKFTPRDGHILVKAVKVGDMLQISIRDTGIGIPEEAHEIIFQPFMQLDSSNARSYEGTGLGLALVRQMVKLVGGKISVYSRPGEGSEFVYTIPLINSGAEGEIPVEN